MDPTALAAAATALLAPYIAKAGEALAETLGEALPGYAGRLWNAIRLKFKGKPAAEEAAQDLAAQPNDADARAAFRVALKKALSDDDDFAALMEALVPKVQAQADRDGIAINVGGDLTGQIIIGDHNQMINDERPRRQT